MHELPVILDVLDLALRHAEANGVSKIISIKLRLGALCDAKGLWLQRYFGIASRGTKAEGAVLDLDLEPAKAKCSVCGHEFEPRLASTERVLCPLCGGTECTLIAGIEYFLESMEAI